MTRRCVIDGNNLLHAVVVHAPSPAGGREALVRRIREWSSREGFAVTLVFDGAPPTRGLKRQLAPQGLDVRFSAPRTADDVIVDWIHAAPNPDRVLVVTDDKAILYEARRKGCTTTPCADFVGRLFDRSSSPTPHSPSLKPHPSSPTPDAPSPEKPTHQSPEDAAYWRKVFDIPDAKNDPDEGMDGMLF